MAAIRALEQVALPQQAVGMDVGDIKRRLQSLRGRRDAQLDRHHPVLQLLDPARRDRKELTAATISATATTFDPGQKPFLHRTDPLAPLERRRGLMTRPGLGHRAFGPWMREPGSIDAFLAEPVPTSLENALAPVGATA